MSAHRLAATPPRSLPDRNVHEPVALALLAGVGVASALWALYLWEHLVLARAGWSALCATGEQAACAAAWDSPFAFTVHRLTGMPLAGWGLTWSIAAFVFPLIGLLRLAQRRAVSPLLWASRWLAVSGGMAVLLLGLISFFERAICPDCLVSYLLIFLYLVVTLTIWDQMSMGDARRGLVLAAGACGGVFLLLLGPGLRTPRSSVDGAGGGLSYSSSPGTGDPKRDQQLARFVAALSPEDRQTLSDSLYVYRSSGLAPVASRETGQPAQTAAPVKITTFTDVFCPECGLVEETLESLRRQLPPGSFSVERRYYPLASECNPRALVRHGKSVHCFAAVAQICLEDDAGARGSSSDRGAR